MSDLQNQMIGNITFISWLVSALGMSLFWVKLLATAEEKEHLNPLFQRRVRRWLRASPAQGEPNDATREDWSNTFITLFDRTFGTRLLSWRFFLRSCLATTVFFALMILVYVGFGLMTYTDLINFLVSGRVTPWERTQWILIAFAGNLIADYLSLMETRLILQWIKGRSLWVKALGLGIDVCATSVIFIAVAASLYAIELIWWGSMTFTRHLHSILGTSPDTLNISWGDKNTTVHAVLQFVFGDAILLGDGKPRDHETRFYADLYRIGFITTFFTSVWIWLFILAGGLSRIFLIFRGQITRLGRLFNVEAKPLTAVGYMLAVLTFIVHVAAYTAWAVHEKWTTPTPQPAAQVSQLNPTESPRTVQRRTN